MPSSVHESLVSKALEQFHAELGNAESTFTDVASPEELLAQARALKPLSRDASNGPVSMFRLETILSHINDFAAIVALSSGAGSHVAGAVWGSLKIVIMLAGAANDTFDDILTMLDELASALPRFRKYEDTLPMTPVLEAALVDVYAEMACFCARAVRFFKSAPRRSLVRAGWARFDGDFQKSVKRLRNLSQLVDREADACRLKADTDRNTELVEALESLKYKDKASDALPLFYVPSHGHKHFFGRQLELSTIEDCFSCKNESASRCVLLHGLGGVGKSRIALEYVNRRRSEFDVVLWLSAENEIKIEKAFSEVAHKLALTANDNTSLASSKVTEWLASSSCRWLLVFDNAESIDTLDMAPATSTTGSIIITSRDPTIAFGMDALVCQVKPFDNSDGTSALFKLLGRKSSSARDQAAASAIVETMGGLPLAITQVSGFIAQQQLSLPGFVPFYERNAAKINGRSLNRSANEHTLNTVWEIALNNLPPSSHLLQGLLAFFDPDKIYECVLVDGAPYLDEDTFGFMLDEFDFMEAKEALYKTSLLHRDSEESSLSMHRLVQAAVIRRMSPEDRVQYLEYATIVLSHGFANTWNVVTSHQFDNWAKCELRVAHVQSLITQHKKYNLRPNEPRAFAELVFRCAWHLYERELYSSALDFLNSGIKVLGEDNTLCYSNACTLRGLVELDQNELEKALSSFLDGLQIRQKLLQPDDAFIASSYNAISLACTELGQLPEALRYGNQAIEIRLATNSNRIGNSYSNMASTLLRLGKPDEAEEMLGRCPSLKDFTDNTFLGSGNPRFAGDMILLSRIRQQQGRPDEAVRLASKALTFRQRTHGNHLKTCDIMQLVASMMQVRNEYSAAITLWQESEVIAAKLSEAHVYLVRARCKLATCYEHIGDEHSSRSWADAAKTAHQENSKLKGKEHSVDSIASLEQLYDSKIPWMLW